MPLYLVLFDQEYTFIIASARLTSTLIWPFGKESIHNHSQNSANPLLRGEIMNIAYHGVLNTDTKKNSNLYVLYK